MLFQSTGRNQVTPVGRDPRQRLDSFRCAMKDFDNEIWAVEADDILESSQ